MTTPAFSFKHVVAMAGGTEFDLEVPMHQCVAIVGDGKSGVDDLCAVALGLLPPVSGSVEIMGQDLRQLGHRDALAFRRKLGYLPAGDGLMQNLSLSANIALPLRFGSDYKPSAIRGRVNVILAALRITDVAGARPAAARDEHRRRAAFGRALAFDPQVLLLEAPFDGLTDTTAIELLEIVRGGEHSEGSRRTVLFTTQHLPAAVKPRIDGMFRAARGVLSFERSG